MNDDGNWDGDETALMGCGLLVALIVSVVAALSFTIAMALS